MSEQRLGRRLQGDGGQGPTKVGFVEAGVAQPGGDRILAKPSQGRLIGHGKDGESVGVAMPVPHERRVGESELDGRVDGLAALSPGRQIATGHDIQLPVRHATTLPAAVKDGYGKTIGLLRTQP